MNEQHLKNVVEAALLAAGLPQQPDELRDLFDEFERPGIDEVRAALAALAADYEGRGVEVREVASGFRIQVREAVAAPVSRLWQERPPKYSRAFLETLALIAYRQPITRGEIEEIRGVAVNPNIVKTLMERGWVRVVGHREVPGRPEVLGTTREFLDYFGLKSLDDLPTLAQLRGIETLGVQLEFAATAAPAPEAAEVQAVPGDDGTAASGAPTAGAEAADEAGATVDADAGATVEADAGATVEADATDEAEPVTPFEDDTGEGEPMYETARAASDDGAASEDGEDERRAADLVATEDSGTYAVREPRD